MTKSDETSPGGRRAEPRGVKPVGWDGRDAPGPRARDTALVELTRPQWELLVKILEERCELEWGSWTEAEDQLLSLVRDDTELPDGWDPSEQYGEVVLAQGIVPTGCPETAAVPGLYLEVKLVGDDDGRPS